MKRISHFTSHLTLVYACLCTRVIYLLSKANHTDFILPESIGYLFSNKFFHRHMCSVFPTFNISKVLFERALGLQPACNCKNISRPFLNSTVWCFDGSYIIGIDVFCFSFLIFYFPFLANAFHLTNFKVHGIDCEKRKYRYQESLWVVFHFQTVYQCPLGLSLEYDNKPGNGPWHIFNIVRIYVFHELRKWKPGIISRLLDADWTFTDSETGDVQAK